jgi:hypothetical protein
VCFQVDQKFFFEISFVNHFDFGQKLNCTERWKRSLPGLVKTDYEQGRFSKVRLTSFPYISIWDLMRGILIGLYMAFVEHLKEREEQQKEIISALRKRNK